MRELTFADAGNIAECGDVELTEGDTILMCELTDTVFWLTDSKVKLRPSLEIRMTSWESRSASSLAEVKLLVSPIFGSTWSTSSATSRATLTSFLPTPSPEHVNTLLTSSTLKREVAGTKVIYGGCRFQGIRKFWLLIWAFSVVKFETVLDFLSSLWTSIVSILLEDTRRSGTGGWLWTSSNEGLKFATGPSISHASSLSIVVTTLWEVWRCKRFKPFGHSIRLVRRESLCRYRR